MKKDNHYIKILFEEEYIAGEIIKETLWAIDLGNQSYQIDSIPFYAFSVACGDVFSAVLENDVWVATDLLHTSENSTIRILFTDTSFVATIREILLSKYGCESELSNLPQLLAVNIPKEVAYQPIKGQWEYQEASLSDTHFGV
jgi:predicted HAD superfamily hydrolase